MKLLDLLAKLGILRFGIKKGVYHSAKDMPSEFLMNDVFNAERDLTTAEDIKNVAKAISRDKSAAPTAAFCTHWGKPVTVDQRFCTACGGKLKE